ncbi:MAG: hypothetical protein JWM12_4384 [Ilumatobacteraceae bacterium]|nr:hypothetical protein [Ilumatobacteraceae bacterium]
MLVGVAAPLVVLASLLPAGAASAAAGSPAASSNGVSANGASSNGASWRSSAPRTAPPGSTVPGDTTPATSTTVAASGEDTGLGPEVTVAGQNPPLISVPQVQSAPLVAVPAGCPTPAATTAVFIGKVDKMDFRTAQFTVQSVRAGTLDGFAVGDQVQVRYGPDVRFLDNGTTYIVGATPDPATGLLMSKIREPTELYGGDAVAGVNESDLKCPSVEDPVMTLTDAATAVDSGLFTPLRKAKGDLMMAVLRPLAVGLAVLIGLVLVKQLVFAIGRSLRSTTVTERTVVRVPRARRAKVPKPANRTPGRIPRSGGRGGVGAAGGSGEAGA